MRTKHDFAIMPPRPYILQLVAEQLNDCKKKEYFKMIKKNFKAIFWYKCLEVYLRIFAKNTQSMNLAVGKYYIFVKPVL